VANLKDISSVWNNIKEIDLKPIRETATRPIRIVIVGEPGTGRHTLAEQMRTDPVRPDIHTQSAISFPVLDEKLQVPNADLIIVIADATRTNFSLEQLLVKTWNDAGKNVLVIINKLDLLDGNTINDTHSGWQADKVLFGSVNDTSYLQHEFIPAVLELLPQQHLSLGRQFPLFRVPIARQVINDTCFSNAAYSFSTGLAEIVPVMTIPLTVTDMVILTKSQAFLAYKLGLLVGFSTNWQDYLTEFGGVIGGGFIWRQIARQFIGLIPGWGVIPKVAVAYSGTYVVGHAILGWYINGRHLTRKQMRALTTQAFTSGKAFAYKIGQKLPRPRGSKGKKGMIDASTSKAELTQGEIIIKSSDGATRIVASGNTAGQVENVPGAYAVPLQSNLQNSQPKKRKRITLKRKKKSSQPSLRTCTNCGKNSSQDAGFCQYCGNQFEI